MSVPRPAISLVLLLFAAGCQSAPGPIFSPVSPPIVWPSPPDRPRICYVGDLRGAASLGAKPSGWNAFRAVLIGPRPLVEFSRPAAVAVAGELLGRVPDTFGNCIGNIGVETQDDFLRLKTLITENTETTLTQFVETEIGSALKGFVQDGYIPQPLHGQEDVVVMVGQKGD